MPPIRFGGRSSVSKGERNSPRLPVDKYGKVLRKAERIGAAPLKDWAGNWLARKGGNLAERMTGLPFSEFGSDPVTDAQRTSDELMTGVAAPAITVFHGTGAAPYKQFDWSKIGSGEGAQAFSHGMYTAGDVKTAKQYYDALKKEISGGLNYGKTRLNDVIDMLAGKSITVWDSPSAKSVIEARRAETRGNAFRRLANSFDDKKEYSPYIITDSGDLEYPSSQELARQAYDTARRSIANEIRYFRANQGTPGYPKSWTKPVIEKARREGKVLKQFRSNITGEPGYTQGGIIKADLPDDVVSRMLRWDSSLYEQPTRVQEFLTHQAPGTKDSFFDILQRRFRADRGDTLQSASPGAMHGSDIYRGLATELEYGPKTKKIKYRALSDIGDPGVSQLMNDAGITGTKFLSGFSRHRATTPLLSPPEAFNYVSFRDYLPRVLDYYPESRFGELGIR